MLCIHLVRFTSAPWVLAGWHVGGEQEPTMQFAVGLHSNLEMIVFVIFFCYSG